MKNYTSVNFQKVSSILSFWILLVTDLDVEVALAACFDLHEEGLQLLVMDHVRLVAVDHLLCLNNSVSNY